MNIKWIVIYTAALVAGILGGGFLMNQHLRNNDVGDPLMYQPSVRYVTTDVKPIPMPDARVDSGLWQLKYNTTIPA